MDEPNSPPASRSSLLAVEDTEFLLRDEMRAIRFGLEYAKPELELRDWGIRSTIIVFGSARVASPEQAEAAVAAARTDTERTRAEVMRKQAELYQIARAFAGIAARRGGSFAPKNRWRDNVIATGGGPGIMEAANRGAHEVGAPTIGFNITLPHEQAPNPYITPQLYFRFHYFAMRKMHLAMRANALAVFPGGFGTFDELFEVLTLQQTRKAPPAPIVLFHESYWRKVINFDALAEEGVIAAEDLKLFEFAETAEDGWASLTRRGLRAHGATPTE
ncbi:MAG: LOG family protein [Xanthobacteraceae bacterium]|nr:LOG family protein [Xanthobacteraceae bacterium]